MRKSLWIILSVLLFTCLGVPGAHADNYVNGVLTFTLTREGPDASGSFLFDYTTDQFLHFPVYWDGNVYDFTSIANTDNYYAFLPTTTPDAWCAAGPTDTVGFCGGGPAAFLYFTPVLLMVANASGTDVAGSDEAVGNYTVSCVDANLQPMACPAAPSVPEPSVLPMLFLGAGLLGLTALKLKAVMA